MILTTLLADKIIGGCCAAAKTGKTESTAKLHQRNSWRGMFHIHGSGNMFLWGIGLVYWIVYHHTLGLWSLNGIHSWSNAWANTTSFAHEQLFNWIRGPISHAPVSSDNPRVCQLCYHNIAALYHMHVWSGLGRSCPLAIHFVKWKFCILLPIQLQTIKDWHLWNGSANCAR